MQKPQASFGRASKYCEEKKKSLTECQKQVILAKQRGEQHIGENKIKR